MSQEEETAKDAVAHQTIAYGVQDPFEVWLPQEKVKVSVRLATGMDGFAVSQRWKKIDTLDMDKDRGLFELEIIARCIISFPDHPEFGRSATKPVTFNELLFLKDIDIKVLKMAYAYANMPDPQTQSILENLALGHTTDALQEALWLVLNLKGGITLDAALKLPEKTRWEMIDRIQILLGLTSRHGKG